MRPKVIKSDAEHAAALAQLDKLMAARPAPGTPKAEELELLSVLIERYEDERFPLDAGPGGGDSPPHGSTGRAPAASLKRRSGSGSARLSSPGGCAGKLGSIDG
jgi:hypothetical protein